MIGAGLIVWDLVEGAQGALPQIQETLQSDEIKAEVRAEIATAIDAGLNPWALASDQRGGCHRRDHGAGVDIGAAEAQPATADCLSGKRGRRRD